jgi:hypothetical protein
MDINANLTIKVNILSLSDTFCYDLCDSTISISCFPQEKIRVALYVQKAAIQFIDGMKL